MNMDLYNRVREVPDKAKKPITGGRLKGMTDIKPIWRIEKLTEEFGPCGVGWYYTIDDHWVDTSMAKDEITANVIISLYYKVGDEWSMPVQGIGGSMLLAKERNGLYTNDECFKMATTDAISYACKSIGIGADVYWGTDNTKYGDNKHDGSDNSGLKAEEARLAGTPISATHIANIRREAARIGLSEHVILNEYKVTDLTQMTEAQYGDCMNKIVAEANRMSERVIGAE